MLVGEMVKCDCALVVLLAMKRKRERERNLREVLDRVEENMCARAFVCV